MKRTLSRLALALALSGVAAAAQDVPVERLPQELAERIQARMDAARTQGIPESPVALLALEGVAKGRSAAEVLGAVDALLAELGRARGALVDAGHAPGYGEVEAATAAMRMGVDGAAVSALAKAGPSGRGLAVPLLIMGGLAQRGLPSDQALAAVRGPLAAGAGDEELLVAFPGAAGGLGRGIANRPDHAGSGMGLGGGGFHLPAAGIMVPMGPPTGRPRPGRGPGGG